MKNIQSIKKIKFLALAVVLGLGINYAIAVFGPTSTPPGANKENILNQSGFAQTKGGSGAPIAGSVLNLDGTMSATNLFVSTNLVIDGDVANTDPNGIGDFYITSITGTPTRACVDSNHKIILCP